MRDRSLTEALVRRAAAAGASRARPHRGHPLRRRQARRRRRAHPAAARALPRQHRPAPAARARTTRSSPSRTRRSTPTSSAGSARSAACRCWSRASCAATRRCGAWTPAPRASSSPTTAAASSTGRCPAPSPWPRSPTPSPATRAEARGVVLADGGVRSGLDVLVALALGADAVLLGRPALWALATGGADGVTALVDQVRDELTHAMALAGAPDLDRDRPQPGRPRSRCCRSTAHDRTPGLDRPPGLQRRAVPRRRRRVAARPDPGRLRAARLRQRLDRRDPATSSASTCAPDRPHPARTTAPVNRGLAWNWNRAVPLARGRYFKWAAADDVHLPGVPRPHRRAARDRTRTAVLAHSPQRRHRRDRHAVPGRPDRAAMDAPHARTSASTR